LFLEIKNTLNLPIKEAKISNGQMLKF